METNFTIEEYQLIIDQHLNFHRISLVCDVVTSLEVSQLTSEVLEPHAEDEEYSNLVSKYIKARFSGETFLSIMLDGRNEIYAAERAMKEQKKVDDTEIAQFQRQINERQHQLAAIFRNKIEKIKGDLYQELQAVKDEYHYRRAAAVVYKVKDSYNFCVKKLADEHLFCDRDKLRAVLGGQPFCKFMCPDGFNSDDRVLCGRPVWGNHFCPSHDQCVIEWCEKSPTNGTRFCVNHVDCRYHKCLKQVTGG